MSDSIPTGDGKDRGASRADHYLWIATPLIAGASLAQALMRQGISVLYPFIQIEFGLSRAQVGLISSAQAIGYGAAVVFAGWLADTLGVKRMITISLLALTALTLTFPLVYSFYILLALTALIGIVTSPVHPATARAVIDWFPVRSRGLAMGMKQMGIPIAGALSAAVLPALALAMGWRMAAAVGGLLVLSVAIVFILLYRDAPRSIQPARKFAPVILVNLLRNRGLVTSMLWGFTFIGIQQVVLSYFMLFLIEEIQLSPIMAGGLLAIAQVSSIIARVLWGAISDFVFHGRRKVVLVIIGFLTILWTLGAGSIGGDTPIILVYLIAIAIGVSTLSFHGVFHTLVGEQAEAGQIGVTAGVASTMTSAGQMVMPPLFGYLVDITGLYSSAWRAAAVVALIFVLALLVFGRDTQQR